MTAEAFFDTNLVVYAFIDSGDRSEVAERLLANGGIVSIQVLNEFTSVARRKRALTWTDIRTALASLGDLCGEPRPLTAATHDAALNIAERHGRHIYDALIIASAAEAGCRTLYTEDIANGQVIAGVRLINPFA